jgi:hypothetical protein
MAGSLTDIMPSINVFFQSRREICGYYFEMSHLITNLKCHIGKLSSKNYRRIGDGKNIDYGGRVEET